MLAAIKEFGRRKRETNDELTTLIQTPKGFEKKENDPKVIFIKVNTDRNRFDGIELEDYDSQKICKYLYRRGSSNGPDIAPSSILTEVNKTFRGKILSWFKDKTDPFLKKIQSILEQNQDEITEQVTKRVADFRKNQGKLLTLKINGKYIGEFEIFKEWVKTGVRIQTRKSGTVAEKQVCSLCGERKEVSGDPRVFTFYTIDKPGFIAGGLDKKSAWKNFPLCYDCKLDLEEGWKFIKENLKFKFYGVDYYLIPRQLISEVKSEIINILIGNPKKITLTREVKKRITNDETEILDILKEEQDIITVNFLFLKEEQSAQRILLLIEDVFPSRIREIFQAKDEVDKIMNGNFTLGCIRTFFRTSSPGKTQPDLDKYFLEIVNSIFKGVMIDKGLLFRFFMSEIRNQFFLSENNKGDFSSRVNDALMAILFLLELKLVVFKEVKVMADSRFDQFFEKYPALFQHPAKKGVFLLGALTQLLLNKQYADRESAPFRKNLKSLKLSESDIRALLPKVQNKLEEYKAFDQGKRQIASEISKYLLAAGENWKIPLDELNFYFACGMNMIDDVKSIIYEKQNAMEV